MFESINTNLTEEIRFVTCTITGVDYDTDSDIKVYTHRDILSNVHDITENDREYRNPQFKTNRTIKLTNNLGVNYTDDDYFRIGDTYYVVKRTRERPTYMQCLAENVDITNIPAEVEQLLDHLGQPLLDHLDRPLLDSR